jgi:thiamine-phosphate pyrophosphorylase
LPEPIRSKNRRLLLYYITDRTQFGGEEESRCRTLLDTIAEAARWGVDFIQLREKDLPAGKLESLARKAVRVVREQASETGRRTRILINSRVDVAIACAADGVHLRSNDISPRDVRDVWKRSAMDEQGEPVIGVSCHTRSEVAEARSQSADFAVFAPVFAKKETGTAASGLDALRQACQESIPVLALGGITLDNAQSCLDVGAAGIAGIRLFQQGDIRSSVARLRP